jgi:hypothetical protein
MPRKTTKSPKSKAPDAAGIFERELRRRKVAFTLLDDGAYVLDVGGGKLTVSLENVARDLRRDGDEAAIPRFVERCLSSLDVPAWNVARTRVYLSAERFDRDFGDTLREKVTDEVTRVLVVTDAAESKITWLTPRQRETWGVELAELEKAARTNLDALLAGKKLEVAEADGKKLGMVPVASAFKASLVFAPSFRRFVEPTLGWPVLAVIPCRDFIYVIAEKDKDLLGRMGAVVQREFRQSGYPITTEVLRLSDEGVEAIGKFPE